MIPPLVLIGGGNNNAGQIQRPFEDRPFNTFSETEPFWQSLTSRLHFEVPDPPSNLPSMHFVHLAHAATLDGEAVLLKAFIGVLPLICGIPPCLAQRC